MDILSIENVVKNYANHRALDKVSFSVPRGQIFGLLGPNGAGKTTMLRIVNQITAPDSGRVLFDGEPISRKHISRIGYLPEERGLYPKMKVGDQAIYFAQLKGLSRYEAIKRLKKWFVKFEIQQWWNKKVQELSKGMQQKVQFITTIIHEPELLIFDEPFTGFDPINVNLLKQEILELKKQGTSIIFSTHNMSSVEELCDHIALINKSKKILEGQIDEIKEKYKSNVYSVTFRGNFNKIEAALTADFKLKNIEETENGNINAMFEIINKNKSTNDLISHLIKYGSIISFNEKLPSMDDIFIRVVEESNSLTEKNE